jgi:cyclopropane fatty-acyl-phospholipid synthase-like methyltransferase
MNEKTQADPRRKWRQRAGNPLMYDTMGATQFAILTLFFGLRERHKLLEIGAGSLRAGRFLIAYLDAGHYLGVEPDEESIRLGTEFELGLEMAERKKPRFMGRDDFAFHEFGQTFDYALSYSVFTHVPPPQVPIIFENAAKCFHNDSIMLATAVFADGEERIVDPQKWTNRPINEYSVARLEDAARAAGLKLVRLGKVFQDWFVAFKEGNRVATAGAEAMSKVAWGTVTPKWENPGWNPVAVRKEIPPAGHETWR